MEANASQQRPGRPFTIRHRLEYGLYLFFRTLARMIGERGLDLFGGVVAATAFRLVRRRTDLAMRNLAMVYPDMAEIERENTVRSCWRHYAREGIRYIRDSAVPFDEIASRFDLVGRENMEVACGTDKGVILVSAHFGAWENALSVLAQFGRKVVVVGRVLDNPLLHARLYEGRTRSGFELLDRRSAARELVRALQSRAIVVLLVDQAVQDREGAVVPFLGHDAWTTTSAARLGLKYDCPILSVFCYPVTKERRQRVEFTPVFETEGLDEVEVMTRVNETIGRRIDADPHLWLWFHDRWKGVAERRNDK